MKDKEKKLLLKFLDIVEIFSMRDIIDVFQIDPKTLQKYLGENRNLGKRRGVNRNGRRYYSVRDISEIMNMNHQGVKILMLEYYKKKNNNSPTHELWLEAKNRIKGL